jgi:hypothetical protein
MLGNVLVVGHYAMELGTMVSPSAQWVWALLYLYTSLSTNFFAYNAITVVGAITTTTFINISTTYFLSH